MNPYLFFSALRARSGVFFLVLAVTIVAATVVSLLLPKTYKGTVALLVDSKEEQSLSTVLRPFMQVHERVSYLQTQMDIIKSEKVARQVVRDLKLTENPAVQEAFAKSAKGVGSVESWLVEDLLQSLKVETTQSSIIHLSVLSNDPNDAAEIANAYAKAYIDTTLELRVEPTRQAAAWFDEQLKSLRANLEDAQARLTDYHRKKGIISADERLDVESTSLGELSAQVVRAQDQTFDWKIRQQQARDFLQGGGSPDRLPEVSSNSFIQKLKGDLAAGEAKLQELATQYGSNYPQYQRQLSENESLRKKLDAEMRKIVAGFESSTRQSREREAELRKAMAAQRARLLERKEDRNELTVLARDVESAQRAYDTAMQRAVVSQVESRASQANVAVLTPAVAPRMPARPKIVLNIALSVVVGMMLGIGTVILMEMFDRRVRSRIDLDNVQNVPLLGVLNTWRPPLLGRSSGTTRALPSPG